MLQSASLAKDDFGHDEGFVASLSALEVAVRCVREELAAMHER